MATPWSGLAVPAQCGVLLNVGLVSTVIQVDPGVQCLSDNHHLVTSPAGASQRQLGPVPLTLGGREGAAWGATGVGRHQGGVSQGLLG